MQKTAAEWNSLLDKARQDIESIIDRPEMSLGKRCTIHDLGRSALELNDSDCTDDCVLETMDDDDIVFNSTAGWLLVHECVGNDRESFTKALVRRGQPSAMTLGLALRAISQRL